MKRISTEELSARVGFVDVEWDTVPAGPGVYVIYDLDEVVYVGMAGRSGRGSLRNRLRDHRSGQMVNMFAQYLFLARVQFLPEERVTHPREAKALLRKYMEKRCSFRYRVAHSADEARRWEKELKTLVQPTLNP